MSCAFRSLPLAALLTLGCGAGTVHKTCYLGPGNLQFALNDATLGVLAPDACTYDGDRHHSFLTFGAINSLVAIAFSTADVTGTASFQLQPWSMPAPFQQEEPGRSFSSTEAALAFRQSALPAGTAMLYAVSIEDGSRHDYTSTDQGQIRTSGEDWALGHDSVGTTRIELDAVPLERTGANAPTGAMTAGTLGAHLTVATSSARLQPYCSSGDAPGGGGASCVRSASCESDPTSCERSCADLVCGRFDAATYQHVCCVMTGRACGDEADCCPGNGCVNGVCQDATLQQRSATCGQSIGDIKP